MLTPNFTIGSSLFPINNMLIFKGLQYIFKADGVFQIYCNPDKINETDDPMVIKVYHPPTPVSDLGIRATVYMGWFLFTAGGDTYCLDADDSEYRCYRETVAGVR